MMQANRLRLRGVRVVALASLIAAICTISSRE
jgi:hypothetical protein